MRNGDRRIGDCISNGTESLLSGIDQLSSGGSRGSIYANIRLDDIILPKHGCSIGRKAVVECLKYRLTSDLVGEGKVYTISARHSCTGDEARRHDITVWPSIQLPIGFRGIPAEFLSPPAIKEYLRDFCGNKKKEGRREMRGDRNRHACLYAIRPMAGTPPIHLVVFDEAVRKQSDTIGLLERSYLLYIYSAARKTRSDERF